MSKVIRVHVPNDWEVELLRLATGLTINQLILETLAKNLPLSTPPSVARRDCMAKLKHYHLTGELPDEN